MNGAEIDVDKFTESNHPALHYQYMLADHVRMARYREAIDRVVRPGDVVADLGTGLGVLALMAARAGAKRVYGIDNRPRALWVAEHVRKANPGGERVQLVEGDARELELDLDEPVSVIVNELIGDFGTDENIYECVAGFARRHLAPDGRIVPERLTTFLVPVEYHDEFRGVWRDGFHGLDLRPAIDFPCQPQAVMYGIRHLPKELACAQVVEDIHFGADMGERNHTIDLVFEVSTPGTLQGFVGYFDSTLVDGIGINNYPCYPSCHWDNWNWPVSPPLLVEPGQRLEARLNALPNMIAAGWTMEWKLV